jgi:hypothetical protein
VAWCKDREQTGRKDPDPLMATCMECKQAKETKHRKRKDVETLAVIEIRQDETIVTNHLM